jgi:hypothetical protein
MFLQHHWVLHVLIAHQVCYGESAELNTMKMPWRGVAIADPLAFYQKVRTDNGICFAQNWCHAN